MWRVTIVSGLQAHFLQPNGPPRPGTDWIVEVCENSQQRRAIVRTYGDRTPAESSERQASRALSFVTQLLQEGWDPKESTEPIELTVPDDFATPESPPQSKAPWWRFW